MKDVSPSPPTSAKPLYFTCLGLLLLFGSICFIPFALPHSLRYTAVARKNYSSAAQGFAYALLDNNSKAAKSFVVSTQWARVDQWVEQRVAFHCPFTLTFDEMEGEVAGTVGSQITGSKEADYSFGYACTHEDYSLSVDDIHLQQQANGEWQIVAWKVCEKRKGQPEECD